MPSLTAIASRRLNAFRRPGPRLGIAVVLVALAVLALVTRRGYDGYLTGLLLGGLGLALMLELPPGPFLLGGVGLLVVSGFLLGTGQGQSGQRAGDVAFSLLAIGVVLAVAERGGSSADDGRPA
jgi:hypothetical protein